MACIASTFTGSVAALKASKVQVRVARSPSPSRPFFRPLHSDVSGKKYSWRTRADNPSRSRDEGVHRVSPMVYRAAILPRDILPRSSRLREHSRIPAMDVILRVAASTRFRETSSSPEYLLSPNNSED